MGKQYDSKIERYSGYVVLPEYYDWDKMIAWDENVYQVQLLSEQRDAEKDKHAQDKLRYQVMATQAQGILPMVLEWHITGIPEQPEKLPATPVKDAAALHYWLIGIINSVILGDENPDLFLSEG